MLEFFLYLIIQHFPSYGVLAFFVLAALDEKIRWVKFAKFVLFAGTPSSLLSFLFFSISGIHVIIQYVLSSVVGFTCCALAIAALWKRDLWRSLSITGIAAIMQVSTSSVIASAYVYLPSADAQQFFVQTVYFINLPIALLISLLLQKIHFSRSVRYLLKDDRHIRRITIEIFLLEFSVEIFFTLIRAINAASQFTYVTTVVVLVLLHICIIAYLSYKEESAHKLQMQESVILQQQMYAGHLEEMQRDMRSFRHDYKNTLSGMYLHAQEGDVEEIQKILEKLEIDFDQKIGEKIHLTTQLGNIQIPEVKSLVLSKLTKMNKENIPCSLEALYPVTETGMDIWDFNRCLGILLDNAIEAADTQEHPHVELSFLYLNGFLTVRIANPCSPDTDLNHIWEEGYSTKGEKRGLGLSNYQRILAQYPNTSPMTICEDHTFVQELTICVT